MKNYPLLSVFLIIFLVSSCSENKSSRKTTVSIEGEKFFINGQPTLKGVVWNNISMEGLIPNSRMVQGIFDDLNPETVQRWAYPDTDKWDPDRNTNEFVAAMEDWYKHGLLAFTLNMQGGSPEGYSGEQPWINSAFAPDGSLREDYMKRLEKILDRSDELGMISIVGLFYFGQDQHLEDEEAVRTAVRNAVEWILDKGYTNVIIELANECNNRKYDLPVIKQDRIHELILLAKSISENGNRLLVSTSYNGNTIPNDQAVEVSDFILIHGNGVNDPERIKEMVKLTRELPSYRPMPIVFNEDDHYDFDKPKNNMVAAFEKGASWGYFDFRRKGEGFEQGYQSVPVDWGITSERKKDFFNKLKEITGGN